MSPRRVVVLLAALLLAWLAGATQAHANSTVFGRVVYQSGQPIPGLTVSLVHPVAGRSSPVTTSADGRFQIFNVPAEQTPFYLEVYWGGNLKYRKSLVIQDPRVTVPDIVL
jgi:hypothetical protein